MTFIDHHDVFVGSTDDGFTFAILNADNPKVPRVLTDHGFTPRAIHGRTIYLLPPGIHRRDAHTRVQQALYSLCSYSSDIVDLSQATRWWAPDPPPTVVRFDLSGGHVSATADPAVGAAADVLTRHGFSAAATGYVLPNGMSERAQVHAVYRADMRLWTRGLGCDMALGIPTPDHIPPTTGIRTTARTTEHCPTAHPRNAGRKRR